MTTSTPQTPRPAVSDVSVRMPAPQVAERPARVLPGWPVLAACVVALVGGMTLAAFGVASDRGALAAVGGLLVLLALLASPGFTAIAPGQARVIQLLGRYRGTVRADGLQWV
ncbi:MAG: hypothetical protein ACRCY8_09330, partial [Dermatophilaceae bacterium]